MRILILGGTAWLGGTVAATALERGHEVTCLARGQAGAVPDGATLVAADRADPTAYNLVRDRDWDEVVEVSWQPGFVRRALDALAARAGHWTYVSSCSVYADQSRPGADESAELLTPLTDDLATGEVYGQAKVACELATSDAVRDHLVIARSGLIAGPGDRSDRVGAWVARFARAVDDGEPVLVPDSADQPVQAIDVRDQAGWIVDGAAAGRVGTYNVSGPILGFGDFIARSRAVAGHDGPLELVDPDWLAGQGVEEFMGPESLALWLHDPEWAGFSARATAAVDRSGLTTRPLAQTLTDTLTWERAQGLDRPRRAGLSADRERELLAAWAAR